MSKSKIEWTNRTWNPVTGCTKVSQGCKNCYAERMYERFNGKGSFKNVQTHDDRIYQPLHWKKPSMVFVNSMSDLFHEDVPFSFIDIVFDLMDAANWHSFQILTKRPQRMLEFYNWKAAGKGYKFRDQWPLKNVWLGVSVEDQKAADERIPLLMQTPAAVRFLSCEPLLGPVDLTNIVNIICPADNPVQPLFGNTQILDVIRGEIIHGKVAYSAPIINWVIAGGESGPGARPMHPDWVRSLRDQCKAADVAFFFKQWGEYLPYEATAQPPFWRNCATKEEHDGHGMNFIDPATNEPGKFNGHRWYDIMYALMLNEKRINSDYQYLKVGKHNAGRMLYGKEYNEYPKQKVNAS